MRCAWTRTPLETITHALKTYIETGLLPPAILVSRRDHLRYLRIKGLVDRTDCFALEHRGSQMVLPFQAPRSRSL